MVDIMHTTKVYNTRQGTTMFTTILAVLFPTIALAPSLSLENTQVEKAQVTVEVNSPEEVKVGKILEVIKTSSPKYPDPKPLIKGTEDLRAGELIDISVEDTVPENVSAVTYKWHLLGIDFTDKDYDFKDVRFKPWPDGKSVVFSTPVDGKFVIVLSTVYTFVEEKDGKVGYCTTSSLTSQKFQVGKPKPLPDKPVHPKPNPVDPVDPKPNPDKPISNLNELEKSIYNLKVEALKNGLLSKRAVDRLIMGQEKFLSKVDTFSSLKIDETQAGQQNLKSVLSEWKNTINMQMVGFDENNPDGPKLEAIPDSEWTGWNKANPNNTVGSPFNKLLYDLINSGKLNGIDKIKEFVKSYIKALKEV